MNTRRDNPKSSLWRLAVESFNRILINDLVEADNNIKLDLHTYRHARARLWKEVADVYDIFLVGSCGRALSSDGTPESIVADEMIEMTVLNVLAVMILKGQIDAPVEVIRVPIIGCLYNVISEYVHSKSNVPIFVTDFTQISFNPRSLCV